jgi:hypothetical protein
MHSWCGCQPAAGNKEEVRFDIEADFPGFIAPVVALAPRLTTE